MVLSMYLASFALRLVLMLKVHFICPLPDKQDECVYFTETCERKYFTNHHNLAYNMAAHWLTTVMYLWLYSA